MNRCFFILSIVLVFCTGLACAQDTKRPVAERIITLSVKGESLKSAMDKIAQQGQFTFSYPSALLDTEKKINLTISRKTVREVLAILFGEKINWKFRGNYVILAAAPPKPATEKPATVILSGYVIDGITGEKIPSVSIYEGERMISTVTNKYGFFTIKLDEPGVRLRLKVSKQAYQDTLITITGKDNQAIEIMIHPLVEEEVKKDTIITGDFPAIEFLIPSESFINTQNISDTIYKKWQVSFIPILGTNYRLSGNVINDYSFNILGGYSRGTRKAELAGLFNINREDVKYVQIAGLINADGGQFNGVQTAGLLNMVKKKVDGVQVAGFGNIAWDTVTGVQTAGYFNFNRGYTNAVQIAGTFNANMDTSVGFQMAGVLNADLKPYKGVQIAGVLNTAVQEMDGVQIAGVLNTTVKDMQGVQIASVGNVVVKSFKGVQASAIFNTVVQDLQGTQVSLILNYARKVRGSQVGLINISDSCSGVPVGLLSFVRTGYHRFEISADEIFYLNASLRTGTTSFHNILFAGMDPTQKDTNLWTFGYGLGTSLRLGKSTLLDIDLTAQQINKGDVGPKINLLSKFSVGIEQKITRGIHISTGPVLSAQITNRNYSHYPDIFSDIKPHVFYSNNTDSATHLRMWLGWKLGLRFF